MAPPTPRQREIWKSDVNLQMAENHIDRVYGQRLLEVYALGLVASFVSDEFNHFMQLRPASERGNEKDFSALLFAALNLLLLVPGVGEVAHIVNEAKEVLHRSVIGAEAITEIGNQASATAPEEMEEDEGLATYLRDQSVKMPIFQLVLARRYQLEQERYDKKDEFLKELLVKLDDKKFSGTPLTLAVSKFGPAPAKLN